MTKSLGTTILVIGLLLIVGACTSTKRMAQAAGTGGGAGGKQVMLNLGDQRTMMLVRIPPGKFLMGSAATEKYRDKGEVQHAVRISRPFYMGITHVTVDQFTAFVKDSGYQTDAEKDGWSIGHEINDGELVVKRMYGCTWRNPGFDQKGDHPVVQVSWADAKAFCDWLSKRTGKTILLPTEAQWEYACRAGATTAYPWGDSPDDGKGWANCADQSLKKRVPNEPSASSYFNWDDGFVFTSPVASFKANAFGLYDMIGNAWQWCSDSDRYGNHEALRGGAWNEPPWYSRPACRHWHHPDYRYYTRGFRVVMVAEGVE